MMQVQQGPSPNLLMFKAVLKQQFMAYRNVCHQVQLIYCVEMSKNCPGNGP